MRAPEPTATASNRSICRVYEPPTQSTPVRAESNRLSQPGSRGDWVHALQSLCHMPQGLVFAGARTPVGSSEVGSQRRHAVESKAINRPSTPWQRWPPPHYLLPLASVPRGERVGGEERKRADFANLTDSPHEAAQPLQLPRWNLPLKTRKS